MRLFALLLALLLAACARAPEPGVTVLSFASPYGPSHPFSRADTAWIRFVEARSQGRIRIRPIWSGALLSSDHSMEELRHGVADIGLITPIYARGGAQLIKTQAGFYSGVRGIEQQVTVFRCLGAASPRIGQELSGLKILAVQGGNLPGIITTTRPVRSLADLKGLRLRVPTELVSVLEKLGADPVNMPMGEVYSAMAKGVLDGVVAPGDTFRSLHFAEVARHFNTLAVPRGGYPARAMSMTRWTRLAPADRAVLEAGIAVWEAALASEVRKALDAGLKEAHAKGVTFSPMPAADQTAFDAIYLRDAEANARALDRYGIDGAAAFRAVRGSIGADGMARCGARS
jgi:TRAP-type transport system periplasmic protein